MDQRLRVEDQAGKRNDFEVLGEWETVSGNLLTLKTRRKTGSASIWLDYNGYPVRIGYVLHAGGVVRKVRWEAPWREQTQAWKTQQRNHIAKLVASWHAEGTTPLPTSPLPPSVLGVFDLDGFRFAVEATTASEHAVLSVVNAQGHLTPIADLLHDNGRVCGMVTRPGWSNTPDERKRSWRIESEAILKQSAGEGQR